MPISVNEVIYGLLIVSVCTNLTVEALKKVLDGIKKPYSANVLAIISSAFITTIMSVIYISTNKMPVSADIAVLYLAFVWLGFLVAVLGYDKIIQAMKQVIK